MSRSRRYTPVTGITQLESDTRDQVRAHRRQRPPAAPGARGPGERA